MKYDFILYLCTLSKIQICPICFSNFMSRFTERAFLNYQEFHLPVFAFYQELKMNNTINDNIVMNTGLRE